MLSRWANSERLYFFVLQNHCRWWLQPWNSKTLAHWKKNYDQPRQHIKKQRQYFANKGPSSQGYDFSNGHAWMWELDHNKEGWVLKNWCLQTISVQFSCSVVSDSLRPHESQRARPPCPSPIPRVHSVSCSSSQWCHPAISSSVIPFSSCPQSLPASESFPMSQLFAWGGQSTGVSASASFPQKKSQGWSPSAWTGWISLQSKGLSRVFSNTTAQKHQFFGAQPSSQSNSHIHTWSQEKP